MYNNLTAIALRTIRYNDRYNILSIYTRELGLVSVLAGAGTSRESQRRRAMTMPLSLIECVADMRPQMRRLPQMRDLRLSAPLTALHCHPIKTSVALFLSEILAGVLRDGQPDPYIFDFLSDAIGRYDKMQKGVANFHLAFLYHLSGLLGIQPDMSTYRGATTAVFDLVDGVFRQAPPATHRRYLVGAEATAAYNLSRMTWDNLPAFRYSREQRRRAVEVIIEYYSLHFTNLRSLHSPEILTRLFD